MNHGNIIQMTSTQCDQAYSVLTNEGQKDQKYYFGIYYSPVATILVFRSSTLSIVLLFLILCLGF
jgi:hypothetical protein